MSSETSSDSDTEHDDPEVNGDLTINIDESNNFVQNRTNNIKIEEEVVKDEVVTNHIEQKEIRYKFDVSKHYFEEMETRSGKDYRWIKPLKKPVSHAMMYVNLFCAT